jgi:hypothetical protein
MSYPFFCRPGHSARKRAGDIFKLKDFASQPEFTRAQDVLNSCQDFGQCFNLANSGFIVSVKMLNASESERLCADAGQNKMVLTSSQEMQRMSKNASAFGGGLT